MIRPVSPADERAMRQVYDVGVAAKSVARPWFMPPSYESWLVGMRMPDAEEPQELYAAFDEDGTCTGTSLLFVPAQDNVEKVYADIDVAPEHRRRGVGGALVSHAKHRVRELGRSALLVETFSPGDGSDDHEYARFARSQGFSAAWHELTRHLNLPVADAKLAELAEKAGERSGDYRVETFVDRVPDEFLPGLAGLMGMLAVDAPSGAVDFDAEAVTPDRLLHMYDRERAQQRVHFSALAIHRASGAVVAHSDLVADEGVDSVGQLGTYVHREHRGHHLGMAVKVANLQQLQRVRPGASFVRTMNGDTNQHMVSINVDLGFEIVETSTEWIVELAKS